jgi:hypothetical protein
MPRFSILTNYDQIMRIMTSNYVKSKEKDNLYKNRDIRDLGKDAEYT